MMSYLEGEEEEEEPVICNKRKRSKKKKPAVVEVDSFYNDEEDVTTSVVETPQMFDTGIEGGGFQAEEWDNCGLDDSCGEDDDVEPEWCLFCWHDASDADSVAHVKMLSEFQKKVLDSQNAGFKILVHQIREKYNLLIRKEIAGEPEWTKKSIIGHLNGEHGASSMLMTKWRADSFIGQLRYFLSQHIAKRNTSTGKKVPNMEVCKLYLNVHGTIVSDKGKK